MTGVLCIGINTYRSRNGDYMIKNIIVSYDAALVDSVRNDENEQTWDTLSTYFAYQGIEVSGYELKKYYTKAILSLKNNRDLDNCDIDIEDVFFKMFKKNGIVAKRRHLREFAVLFQILTTEKMKLNSAIKPLFKEKLAQDTKLYTVANGQYHEIKREMKALQIEQLFEEPCCSSIVGAKMPKKNLLNVLVKEHNLKAKETLFITSDKDEVKMGLSANVKVAVLGETKNKEVACSGDVSDFIKYIKGTK